MFLATIPLVHRRIFPGCEASLHMVCWFDLHFETRSCWPLIVDILSLFSLSMLLPMSSAAVEFASLLALGSVILILFGLWYVKQQMIFYYTAIHKACTGISDNLNASQENVGLAICALTQAVEHLQKCTIPLMPDHFTLEPAPGAAASHSSGMVPNFQRPASMGVRSRDTNLCGSVSGFDD